MKHSSSWRALQEEHRYWVISQEVNYTELSPRAKDAAMKRLRELADSDHLVTTKAGTTQLGE